MPKKSLTFPSFASIFGKPKLVLFPSDGIYYKSDIIDINSNGRPIEGVKEVMMDYNQQNQQKILDAAYTVIAREAMLEPLCGRLPGKPKYCKPD